MSVAVVIPNHLPHLDFLREWDELRDVQLIVVQDGPDLPTVPPGFTPAIYTHQDIDADLGKDAWIIPRRTSACRSYGYYKAWESGADFILTLDNDCYPERADYWLSGHLANLTRKVTLDWVPSAGSMRTRGFPYRIRDASDVWLSHGLWSGVPDLDAPTSLLNPALRFGPADAVTTVPRWNFFPMCGMNLAWHRDLTPAMYFGLFGPEYGFDQYDDIWAGVLAKRVLDQLGKAAVTGAPSVEHRKQSNVYTNLVKQAPGLEMNEEFWQWTGVVSGDVGDCYGQLIGRLPDTMPGMPARWLEKFKLAARTWAALFR